MTEDFAAKRESCVHRHATKIKSWALKVFLTSSCSNTNCVNYYGMARSPAFCIREDFKKRFTFLKTNTQRHHITNGRINEELLLL